MKKYHINYEGKILPCRASVRKCPYDEARHGDSYEELYPIVMGFYHNSATNTQLKKQLEKGEILRNLSPISKQLEQTKAPMETILVSLQEAIRQVHSGDLPNHLHGPEKRAIEAAYNLLRVNGSIPEYVPKTIADEAHAKWANDDFKVTRLGIFRQGSYERDQRAVLTELEGKMNEIQQWKNTHSSIPDSAKGKYLKAIKGDFNYYFKALNTSKQLTQPELAHKGSLSEIEQNLKYMNGVELLSLYDDLSLSTKEVEQNLKDINYFNYNRRTDLSETANDNLEAWYNKNKALAQRYLVQSAERHHLLKFVENELINQNITY